MRGAAMSTVRRFAAAGLETAARKRGRRRGRLTVLALDETGRRRKANALPASKGSIWGARMASRTASTRCTRRCVREDAGHALVGFRQWIPEEHVKDPR